MKKELQLISENEYKSDTVSVLLFEDEHSFCFSKLQLENISLKFAWNSVGIMPNVCFIKDKKLVFIGVDTFVVGYNYHKQKLAFFLNTSTNFKWFENINNGMAIITETGVVLINITNQCTLRNCFFFGDIIMGTNLENNKMKISFLDRNEEIISI